MMLRLQNVSAGYNGTDVITNISFEVPTNQNLSIIGPNGCGKTTLLKAIAGLLASGGDIQLNDVSTRRLSQKERAKKMAMLSQLSGIYFTYTVFDTVMMGRYLHTKDKWLGLPSERDKSTVLHCLKAVDLLNEKDREITALSGGQLQRVFLARTLAQEPEIILLDEPTNHLDLKYQVELIEYLKSWAASAKRSVIGVLHDVNLALRLSENILVMKNGQVKAHGKVKDTLTRGLLEDTYGVDVVGYMTDSLRMWEDVGKR